jgi:hypothetical protein
MPSATVRSPITHPIVLDGVVDLLLGSQAPVVARQQTQDACFWGASIWARMASISLAHHSAILTRSSQ